MSTLACRTLKYILVVDLQSYSWSWRGNSGAHLDEWSAVMRTSPHSSLCLAACNDHLLALREKNLTNHSISHLFNSISLIIYSSVLQYSYSAKNFYFVFFVYSLQSMFGLVTLLNLNI